MTQGSPIPVFDKYHEARCWETRFKSSPFMQKSGICTERQTYSKNSDNNSIKRESEVQIVSSISSRYSIFEVTTVNLSNIIGRSKKR